MYLIANFQFGPSDGIVYCSELGDGWLFFDRLVAVLRSVGVITFWSSLHADTHQRDRCRPAHSSIAEALVLLLNE